MRGQDPARCATDGGGLWAFFAEFYVASLPCTILSTQFYWTLTLFYLAYFAAGEGLFRPSDSKSRTSRPKELRRAAAVGNGSLIDSRVPRVTHERAKSNQNEPQTDSWAPRSLSKTSGSRIMEYDHERHVSAPSLSSGERRVFCIGMRNQAYCAK